MLVEILLLILVGVLSLGSYKIIKRLELVDSKINELYENRHEVRELFPRYIDEVYGLHRYIDETLSLVRELHQNQERIYGLVEENNHRVEQLWQSLQYINYEWVNDLERRFSNLENMVMQRVNHVDELFENINLRFEYFNNRLHLINDKVEQSFPNKKTRLRKKINLTYQFRMRRRLDK
jgi:hypothetical protein